MFLGGTGGPDVCFSCYLATVVSAAVLTAGIPDTVRNQPEQYCVLAVPDNQFHATAELPPPNWRLRREDGREVHFWRLGEDHDREQHAPGAMPRYHGTTGELLRIH
jgi:hypothetical protein